MVAELQNHVLKPNDQSTSAIAASGLSKTHIQLTTTIATTTGHTKTEKSRGQIKFGGTKRENLSYNKNYN